MNRKRNRQFQKHNHGGNGHKGHGPSSYRMHDPERVFRELKICKGDCLLDLGCGKGDYAMHAGGLVGSTGLVYALDRERRWIDALAEKVACYGWQHVRARVADITGPLSVVTASVDLCFMATVLHVPAVAERMHFLIGEVLRVLKPQGRLAVIECKKETTGFGPPLHMRISSDDLEKRIVPYGFKTIGLTDLGYNYLIQFQKPGL